MGLILDSTVFIRAERRGESVRQVLTHVSNILDEDQEIGISVITLMELTHGVYRADTRERQAPRVRFVSDLERALPVYTITEDIAIKAGHIDAEAKKQGNTIALADLLIGATALDLGYAVGTSNYRHFKMIPNLKVIWL
jgi:tRNA(fMet)-specific endonuclease VapC